MIGLLPDAMKPGTHGVKTHWIRGFMAFQLARRMSAVMLMVPACPESGFQGRPARPRPLLRTDRPAAAHLLRTMCTN